MQVFTPYANQIKNAKCLDPKRRNKQILELIQIIVVNTNNYLIIKKWNIIKPILPGVKNRFQLYKQIKNHVNVKKWKGYEKYLIRYLFCLLIEYRRKTQKEHACYEILLSLIKTFFNSEFENQCPLWFTKEICYEHQKLLLSKKFDYYKLKFKKERK